MSDENRLGFFVGQKLVLRITVEDVEKAQKLIAWMNKEKALIPVDDYGCRMDSFSWVDTEADLRALLGPIKKAIVEGRL